MHIFSGIGGVSYTNTYPFPPNWKSLTEPASLPLTTDYFPEASELYPFALHSCIEYCVSLINR